MEIAKKMDNNTPRLVNEQDAAQILGLSPRTLRKARCTGALPNGIPELPFYKIGKAIRYDVNELAAIVAACRVCR